MTKRLTIDELEKTLEAENKGVEILPDGNVKITNKSDTEIIMELRAENRKLKDEVSQFRMTIYKIGSIIKYHQ